MNVTLAAVTAVAAVLMPSTATAAPMSAPLPWDKRIKCQTDDPEGRHVVTRYGNSLLGWHHFTGRHNTKKCSTLYAALNGRVDRDDHHGHLEYDAVAFETGVARPRQVKVTVVVQ